MVEQIIEAARLAGEVDGEELRIKQMCHPLSPISRFSEGGRSIQPKGAMGLK